MAFFSLSLGGRPSPEGVGQAPVERIRNKGNFRVDSTGDTKKETEVSLGLRNFALPCTST